jgi:hypothetical protein
MVGLIGRQRKERARVVRDSAWHGEAAVRAIREGHESYAGRRIVGKSPTRSKS